jgi:hypothetical protein
VTGTGRLPAGCVVPVPASAGLPLPAGGSGTELLAQFPPRPAVLMSLSGSAVRQTRYLVAAGR